MSARDYVAAAAALYLAPVKAGSGIYAATCPVCGESSALTIAEGETPTCRNGCPADVIDLALETGATTPVALDNTGTPPAAPDNTGDLLAEVQAFTARFVVLPSDYAGTALALFVLHTWAIHGAHSTPYIAVISPEPRSGKSRVLEVLEMVVRAPWKTLSTSESALFRRIERDLPTLLLDEIDAIFGSNSERTEPLRAALNGGNRPGASATRTVGKGADLEAKDFSVFCPKVLAGIDTGRLPETVRDRSVVIHMARKHRGEMVERFLPRFVTPEVEPLKERLATWAEAATPHLGEAEPELPDDLNDRAADAWEPLLAIADMAGDGWPEVARDAAVKLAAAGDDDEIGRGEQLLRGIHKAMTDRDVIATAELLILINDDDELPFGGWRDGRGLDARTLARQLRPYGVRPRKIRVGAHTPMGYHRDDLRDVWSRYLRGYLPGAEHAEQAEQANNGGAPDVPAGGDVPEHRHNAGTGNARKHGDVPQVPHVPLLAGTPPAELATPEQETLLDSLTRIERDTLAEGADR
ncbi:MAG: DUF3631 domain-containing protein [Solirubrobacteraceae bacterium]|jgi:hypothetical protein